MSSTDETSTPIPQGTARRQLLRRNLRARFVSLLCMIGGSYAAASFVGLTIDEYKHNCRLRDDRRKMLANWARGDSDDAWAKRQTDRGLCGHTRGTLVCRLIIHPDDVPHVF